MISVYTSKAIFVIFIVRFLDWIILRGQKTKEPQLKKLKRSNYCQFRQSTFFLSDCEWLLFPIEREKNTPWPKQIEFFYLPAFEVINWKIIQIMGFVVGRNDNAQKNYDNETNQQTVIQSG